MQPFTPKSSKGIITYFFLYLIAVLVVLTLYHNVNMMFHLNKNGTYVIKPVCLDSETDYDGHGSSTTCIEYGEPEVVAVGQEIKNNLIKDTLIALAISLLISIKVNKDLNEREEDWKRKISKKIELKDYYSFSEIAFYYNKTLKQVENYVLKEKIPTSLVSGQESISFYDWVDREYWMNMESYWRGT